MTCPFTSVFFFKTTVSLVSTTELSNKLEEECVLGSVLMEEKRTDGPLRNYTGSEGIFLIIVRKEWHL